MKIVLILLCLLLSLEAQVATRQNVTALYVATFNRAPDSAGLDYWVNESNLNLEDIAQSFFSQTEAISLYASYISNGIFIDSVYSNLFNREADQDGYNYWLNELNTKSIEKSTFILAVINGSKSSDADILTNKTTVGLSFATAGLNNINDSLSIMSGVDSSISSVNSALLSFSIPFYTGVEVSQDNSKINTGIVIDIGWSNN